MTEASARTGPLQPALLAALVILALLLAMRGLAPPRVQPATASAAAFSGARAMAHVQAIAREPRPHASPAGARARDYLTGVLARTGAEVRVVREIGVSSAPTRRTAAGGVIDNIVARLPGRDPRLPAILVMAHYDSVENAPGAGDNAAGSAAAVEMLRAIASGPRPLRDVIVLLTDGEETGLLGARAFFGDPARVSGVAAAINLEARGSRGRPTLFEAGPKSGGLVRLYLRESEHVSAHSPAATIYGLLPNSTDLTPAIAAGVPGLNFAFTSGEVDYHAPTDNVRNLDPRSVQALGGSTLPVVRRLANMADLPNDAGTLVYGQVPGLFRLSYPAWAGWIVLAAAAVALGLAAALGRVRRSEAARGAAAGLYVLLASAAGLRAVRGLTGVPDAYGSNKPLLAGFGLYELALALMGAGVVVLALHWLARGRARIWAAGLALLLAGLSVIGGQGWAFVAAGVAAAAIGFWAFRTGVDQLAGWVGLVGGALGLGLVAQILLPAVASALMWAAAPAAFAALATALLGRGRPLALVAAALIGLAPLAYALLVGHLTAVSLGALFPGALAVFAFAAALLLAPFLTERVRRAAAAGGTLVGVGLALAAAFPLLTGPSARAPALTQAVYVAEPSARSALVYSGLTPLDPWSERVLRADGAAPRRAPVPEIAELPVWRASARPAPVPPAPAIRLLREGARQVLTVDGQGAREVRLRIDARVAARDVTLNGKPLPGFMGSPGEWRLRWRSDGPPIVIAFTPVGAGSLGVDAAAFHEGWPTAARPLPPRTPREAPWLMSDKTVVIGRARFGL